MSRSLEELGKELNEKVNVLNETEMRAIRNIIVTYYKIRADYPQHFVVSEATVKHLSKSKKEKKGKR